MGAVSGSGINYDQITDTLGRATSQIESKMDSFMRTMNPSSSTDMVKLQQMMQQWSQASALQTNVLKLLGDSLKNIVQKVG